MRHTFVLFCLIACLLVGAIASGASTSRAVAASGEPAACPVVLESARFVGITADRLQYRYKVNTASTSDEPLTLSLALRAAGSGADAEADGATITSGSQSTILMIWSNRALASVALKRVTNASGEELATCNIESHPRANLAQGKLTAVADTDTSEVTIFAHDRTLPSGASVETLNYVDSRLVDRAQPAYPLMAAQQGWAGDVTVEVTIGPGGAVQNAKVYETSDVPAFDEEAVSAAKRSTYSAPTINGEPTSLPYLILYEFRMQGMPNTKPPDPCGVSIHGFHLERKLDALTGILYDVNVDSTSSNAKSAQMMLINKRSNLGLALHLPDVLFERPNSAERMASAQSAPARILWIGPEMDYGVIQSVVEADGTQLNCSSSPAHALDDQGHPVNAPAVPAPTLSGADAYLVLPAHFNKRVFPGYPPDAVRNAQHGCAGLLVHVMQTGAPDHAYVSSGSGNDALDRAALAAANASTYEATVRNGTVQSEYYSANYCFDASPATSTGS